MGRPETANQGQLIYEVQQLQRAQAETNRLLTQLLAALTDASTDQPGARHRS